MSEPGLFDVGVGHACDVVGYCAWRAFFTDTDLMVDWEQFRVAGPCSEEGLDDFGGVGVFGLECWG